MTQAIFTDDVLVDGSRDVNQLRVQGHTTQTNMLQTWENSANNVMAQVTGDGRLQIGDDLGAATPDSLIEAHRSETSTAKPKRGFHALGRISDGLNNIAQWLVGELEVRGSSAVSAVQTALRIRASNLNTGTPAAGAELRGADVEVINDASAGSAALPKATGLQVGVTNAVGKTVTEAVGLRVKMSNAGTITTPYSIYTEGVGPAHVDDYIEMKRPATVPGTPPTDVMRIYPKTDGKLYAKNWSGAEVELGGSGASVNLASICNGRLTLAQNNVPVTSADISSTILYFTPYQGNRIALYNGTVWSMFSFVERNLPLTALLANTNYDIFAYDNAGTLTLEATAWTNNTTRATALVLQDGVLVRSGATTRRYLGTIRTVAAGQCEDSKSKRYVWNYCNRILRSMEYVQGSNHTYGGTTWRSWNGDPLGHLQFIVGIPEDSVSASCSAGAGSGVNGVYVYLGIGVNALIPSHQFFFSNSTSQICGSGQKTVGPSELSSGYNYLQVYEVGNVAGSLFAQMHINAGIWG
jgi:hypothetical protein